MVLFTKDVVSLSQARATLSELSDQAADGAEKIITKNGEGYAALIGADRLDHYHRLEQDHIHRTLIAEACKGLEDILAGRTQDAEEAIDEMIRRLDQEISEQGKPQKPARKHRK
ncbi:MAG TPA: type II toxin-antitoxin system prevent-host-death family antitoxin [Castellaniella sp.]|uniref:type II toxin-antitoxin system prevent-host-death family antitoxin n=1 Tax=Castellaniella sp. TaxID=1955812 RepID=UPI002F0C6A44